jgi:hypothetical protein
MSKSYRPLNALRAFEVSARHLNFTKAETDAMRAFRQWIIATARASGTARADQTARR